MDYSTDSLRTFVAVCEFKSFSLATSRVHKSQGAISAQVAKLEQQAGLKLIDRSQRQFRLTAGGELLLKFAKDILTRTDEIRKSFEEVREGVRGEVKIGATRSVGIYVLPALIERMTKDFPKLKLSLFTQSRLPTYERLKKGELDLAVVLTDVLPEGLAAKSLRCEPLCLVVSPRHSLAARRNISLKEFESIPFILGIKGNEFSDMVDNILEKHGVPKPTLGFTISNLQGRKEAARAGMGVAILPYFAVRDEIRNKTLTLLNIRGVQLRDTHLMLIKSRRSSRKPSVELIRKIIEDSLQEG